MKLKELLERVEVIETNMDAETEIRDITNDSTKVKDGDLYICLKGLKADGNDFINELEDKACGYVTERKPREGIKYVLVKDARAAFSIICQNYFGNPANGMKFVAVIGTNGKTSTSHMINGILNYAGFKTGLLGTLGHFIVGEKVGESLTTPDPYEFNKLLNQMRCRGVDVVVSEVSAHAIALKKLYGIKSDVAILTNITQDHLDFFENFEKYAETKASYFTPEYTKLAIVNVDDKEGRKIAQNAKVTTVTYGTNEPSDVFALDIFPDMDGTKFVVNLFDDILDIKSPFYGMFNVYNLMAAMTAAKALGVSSEVITAAVRRLKPVDGRFNILKNNKGFIIIDYAHTPDGLENLLTTARTLTKARLITVFGCGGDRDASKRKIMGMTASKLSDMVILTSDNPRFEDPEKIIADIESGVSGVDCRSFVNRYDAITYAMNEMQEGDTVVIAGKGAENYIEIKGKKIPYSDTEAVLRRGARK